MTRASPAQDGGTHHDRQPADPARRNAEGKARARSISSWCKATTPEPKDGEVLLKTLYISLDAANRAWMQGATYRSAVEANT